VLMSKIRDTRGKFPDLRTPKVPILTNLVEGQNKGSAEDDFNVGKFLSGY